MVVMIATSSLIILHFNKLVKYFSVELGNEHFDLSEDSLEDLLFIEVLSEGLVSDFGIVNLLQNLQNLQSKRLQRVPVFFEILSLFFESCQLNSICFHEFG